MPLAQIGVFKPRGQCIVLLLAALRKSGVSLSRQEAVGFISERRWFALQDEDWKPYRSQAATGEARWKTLIAWARKDAALRDYVNDFEHNSWSLSRSGHSLWDRISSRFVVGEFDVSRGYLWTAGFKKSLCPDYTPSERDLLRPFSLYRDCFEGFDFG